MKPLIAIGGIPFDRPIDQHSRNMIYYIPQGYIHAVEATGGIPVVIPPSTNLSQVDVLLERVDGILLAGGSDVSPLNYGQEPHPKLGAINERRDLFEIELVKQAMKRNIPILGICRGLQIINVALGGTLYQDLSENPAFTIKHQQYGTNWDTPTHSVKLLQPSILDEVFADQKRPVVNSLHHQAINQLAPGTTALAQSHDGLIEAFQVDNKDVLAIQWHPEAQYLHDANQLKLFSWLITVAQN